MKTKIKDFFIKIGNLIVISTLIGITGCIIFAVWVGAVINSVLDWIVAGDGCSHNTTKPTTEYIELSPKAIPTGEQVESAFVKKELPTAYSPTDNPLYQMQKDYDEWKAKPKVGLEVVFKAVDDSNVRMSDAKSKMERILAAQKNRRILRDSKGRFIKGTGVSFSKRFKAN